MKKEYIKPKSEIINVGMTQMIATSGYSNDTEGNHNFGGRNANERRGTWGNLWE